LKERARPAARALCEATVDPSEAVRRAALEALEKVHPELYKRVVVLLVDANPHNHTQASGALRGMGKDAEAATPVLLAHLRLHSGPPRPNQDTIFGLKYPYADSARADIGALAKLAPTDPEVIKLLMDLSEHLPANNPFYGGQVQLSAVEALREIGKNYPEQRKRIVPALIAAAGEEDRRRGFGAQQSLAAIRALGDFGPDARAAVPALKKLKLHPEDAIRQAASSALEKIERPD
jgi:HEAT repeat protein